MFRSDLLWQNKYLFSSIPTVRSLRIDQTQRWLNLYVKILLTAAESLLLYFAKILRY